MMYQLVIALFVASASANVIQNGDRFKPCTNIVNCFVDPCMVSKCAAFPEAQCRSNYCGGCFADYYVDGRRVDCGSNIVISDLSKKIDQMQPMAEIKPAVRGVCPKPKPNTFGMCAEMCNNCEANGQLCCSNGCGHACMNPVMPAIDPIFNVEDGCPPLLSGSFGACIATCGSHGDCGTGKRCCSNGCGRVCKPEYKGEDNIEVPSVSEIKRESSGVEKRDFAIRYQCPKIDPETMGTCANECENDDQCNGGPTLLMENATKKCCSNGCGKVCTTGVLPEKTGSCPAPPAFGPCVVSCASHFHCPDDSLCCSHGCGQVCKKPVHN